MGVETFHQILRTLKKNLGRPAPLHVNCPNKIIELTNCIVITQQESDTEVMNIKLKCSVKWAFPRGVPASCRVGALVHVITGLELMEWATEVFSLESRLR